MVTHTRFQHYNRHYGKACMTGLFGCRWHRYQQSKDETQKLDLCWFVLLLLDTLYVTVFFYFWLIAENDSDNISLKFYYDFGTWFEWHTLAVALTSVTFAYLMLLMILALLHVLFGHELYMHHVHKVLAVLILVGCITVTILVEDMWLEGWYLMHLSLQATGPYLQLGAVFVMTCLTWIIAKQWMWLKVLGARIFWLSVYLAVMIGLYISPLFIESPCFTESADIPAQPLVLAHRGASAIAPENTLIAFQHALQFENLAGIETDVTISLDGVPIIMHDEDLKRTTNVADVFPDRADDHVYTFNMSELRQLDTGSWFLDRDPYGTAGSLTNEQRHLYRNQTVPTLAELLEIVIQGNTSVMFDILFPYPDNHPFTEDFDRILLETIDNSGVQPQKILWLGGSVNRSFTIVAPGAPDIEDLKTRNIAHINAQHKELYPTDVKEYSKNNISTNVFIVNTQWLYSLYWCGGATSTATDLGHKLGKMHKPDWTMSPKTYLIVWVTVDVVSAIICIFFFIFHKVRKVGQVFNPEVVSLQAAKHRVTHIRPSRNMKEKLIHTAEGLQEVDPGIMGMEAETPTSDQRYISSISDNDVAVFDRSFDSKSGNTTPSVHSLNEINMSEIG